VQRAAEGGYTGDRAAAMGVKNMPYVITCVEGRRWKEKSKYESLNI